MTKTVGVWTGIKNPSPLLGKFRLFLTTQNWKENWK